MLYQSKTDVPVSPWETVRVFLDLTPRGTVAGIGTTAYESCGCAECPPEFIGSAWIR